MDPGGSVAVILQPLSSPPEPRGQAQSGRLDSASVSLGPWRVGVEQSPLPQTC